MYSYAEKLAIRKSLPIFIVSDKVMHNMPLYESVCITLSGAHDDRHNPDKTTPHFPVRRTSMLDDRTACRPIALTGYPLRSSCYSCGDTAIFATPPTMPRYVTGLI